MNPNAIKTFKNPGSIYRGAPFWAWNNKLDADQLCRQIDCFKEMGLGGFHMHPRTGMDTEYLSDEFMNMIKACRDHAEKNDMLAWLYDEDRWPSGAAGGIVTKDEKYRARHLLFTPFPYEEENTNTPNPNPAFGSSRCNNGKLIARYEVLLKNGRIHSFNRLGDGEKGTEGCRVWYAYIETALASSWFNNQTYVDTLNPEALKRFIEVTHEKYYKEVGESFGSTIPAIFTDEPQFVHKQCLNKAEELRNVVLPWTDDLTDSFSATYGGDILDHLPELFWERCDDKASVWRYRYHDHVCERFTQAFSDQVGQWCEDHNIALTGHMMSENSLNSQTNALGESMRGYRSFQIPGIDILCDWMEAEYSTAKQAQSAAHQYGRSGVLSELYGVTNWHFDFAGHKRQGDWQAALGITYRVHHLSMVSMAGEAKRDYPASINYQSPWFKEYPVVEDHFARVNLALTEGSPHVRIGVIHPVESYWLACGPKQHTQVEREERDGNFLSLIKWLLYEFLDFDFISESLLPTQENAPARNGFAVGEMEYEVIVVPGMRTMRSSTLQRLQAFKDQGGRIVFAGEIPSLLDALPSDAPSALALSCEQVPYSKSRIISALEPVREVALTNASGVQVSGCLHQLRIDGDSRSLFICNTSMDHEKANLKLTIQGFWQLSELNTSDGSQHSLAAEYTETSTLLSLHLHKHGSVLLSLVPGKNTTGASLAYKENKRLSTLAGPVPVSLSEPNVLLLDTPEWRIGEGEWQPKKHSLQLDPIIRKELGLPTVAGQMAQPWTDQEPVEHAAFVSLRYTIESAVDVTSPQLALEGASKTRIILNGIEVSVNIDGYFTDESIQKVNLPSLDAGTHTLELIVDYTRKTYLEWCYLLGDFGVKVLGDRASLIEPVQELAYGDWTTQGLPFYAGNLTYHCSAPETEGEVSIRVPHFEGPLVSVASGNIKTKLAFSPYSANLGLVEKGTAIDVTVFGNRANAFGQLHNTVASGQGYWYGPNSWRSKKDEWSEEYQLRPMGILTAPVIESVE